MKQRYTKFYVNPTRILVDEKFIMGEMVFDGMNETADIFSRQVKVSEGKLLAIMKDGVRWHKKKKPLYDQYDLKWFLSVSPEGLEPSTQ